MARPQIHGYNMSSRSEERRLSFVSSAEEKVIRAFQAPYNFLENLSEVAKINFDSVGKYILNYKIISIIKIFVFNDSVISDFSNMFFIYFV